MTKAKVTFPSAPDTSAIDIEDEGSLIVSNPTAMNFTGPGVTVTENPTGTAEVSIPGLQYWTESEDATTQQSTVFTPNNAATDVNAVLLPKGTGANTAQTPDGTTAGGNARGAYATDWQKRRLNANQVASGAESVICGGLDNRASGNQSFVGGGEGNTASGAESFVGGGGGNSATNTRSSVIGGANNTTSAADSVSGGFSCTASGGNSVAFGRSAVSSGQYSAAFGYNGAASGQGSFRTGNFGGSIPYANGVMNGGTINTQCGQIWVPFNFQDSNLAAGATQDFDLDLDLVAGSFAVFGFEVNTVLFHDAGALAPLGARDSFFQRDLFTVKWLSGTPTIEGSVINVIKQGTAAMLTGTITYTISGTNLRVTFTAPTGYAGTTNFTGQIGIYFNYMGT